MASVLSRSYFLEHAELSVSKSYSTKRRACIERGGTLKHALNKANYKMCGSPIAITSNALKINFSELLSLFHQYNQKYGNA
jgi:hypothetical protein